MNKKTIFLIAICILIFASAHASTVARSFSSTTVQPGADLTVTLTVDVTGSETFYAIDELVPSGWTVKDPGTGNAEHAGHVKWAEIQEAKDTTLTYTLTAPNQAGMTTFAGTYMFEGMQSEAQIVGQSQVSVGATAGSTDLLAPLTALVIIIAIVAIALKRK